MGLFWDLGQEKLIAEHAKRVGNLESRVAALEHELAQVRQVLAETLKRLESKISEDIDRDSRTG
jgi:phage shock protein A